MGNRRESNILLKELDMSGHFAGLKGPNRTDTTIDDKATTLRRLGRLDDDYFVYARAGVMEIPPLDPRLIEQAYAQGGRVSLVFPIKDAVAALRSIGKQVEFRGEPEERYNSTPQTPPYWSVLPSYVPKNTQGRQRQAFQSEIDPSATVEALVCMHMYSRLKSFNQPDGYEDIGAFADKDTAVCSDAVGIIILRFEGLDQRGNSKIGVPMYDNHYVHAGHADQSCDEEPSYPDDQR